MHAFRHQAIWQRCQLALYVSSWLLGARARRLLAQSRELIALIISSLTCITNVPTRLGWNPVVQEKGQDMECLKWHGFCVPARVGVTLLPWYAVPKILSQRIPASDHWWKRMWRTFAQNPFVDTRLLNLHHRNFQMAWIATSVCMCLLMAASRDLVALQTSFVLDNFLRLGPLIVIQSPIGCGKAWWYTFFMSFPGQPRIHAWVCFTGKMLPRSGHKPVARGGQVQIRCRDGREDEERSYEDLKSFEVGISLQMSQ